MAIVNLTNVTAADKVDLVLATDTDYKLLGDTVAAARAIAIEFPAFGDGRGFSLAVRLRKNFGYEGEIRATGKTMPDQAQFLARSGFDTIEVNDGREAAYEDAAKRFGLAYQYTNAGGPANVLALRSSARQNQKAS